MKNYKIWLIVSFALVLLLISTFFSADSPKITASTPTETLNDSLESTLNQYVRFANALEIESVNKSKFKSEMEDLSTCHVPQIRNLAEKLLRKNNTVKPLVKHEEVKLLDTIETQKEIKIARDLKALDISKIEQLKNEETFLDLISSKGKKFEYFGETSNHKANGYGIGIFESGSIYKGYWTNNYRHGKGVFTWPDNEKYEGYYVKDLREGQGTYYWKNGETYIGEWKEDKRHGYGTIYRKNGKIKSQGVWENDKFVKK